MDPKTRRWSAKEIWMLVRRQHGVVSRSQLLVAGLSPHAIAHRLRTGRLHQIFRGVYAVGRCEVSREGYWMAAVLACGERAVLSHDSAAACWGFRDPSRPFEVSVLPDGSRGQPGIKTYRRSALGSGEITWRQNIPVTTVPCTLIDLATQLGDEELERAISDATSNHLTTPDHLLSVLERTRPRPGTGRLCRTLSKHTFALTDSRLERLFIPIALRAGLPKPLTRQWVNGFRVDFHWPDLGLVVETDGLSFHRDAFQQRRDRLRDQAHTAAGLTQLRFTHWQVRFTPKHVDDVLRSVAMQLARRS